MPPAVVLSLLAACTWAAVAARADTSAFAGAPYDGREFANHEPIEHGFVDALRYFVTREHGDWPAPQATPPGPAPQAHVAGERLVATVVNHSSVLLQTAGLNLLTDPIWSTRASPLGWAGPRRVRPPGLRFEELPPIHAVILSHNHYDHTDLPTLERLAQAHDPKFIVPLKNATLLAEAGISNVTELDWWQSVALSPQVSVTAVPVRHWSARSLFDRNHMLWAGFVVEAPGGPVYFAGDTGQGDHFAAAQRRFGDFRLALLPIGAYLPRWFMHQVHISPAEAVQAHQTLGAARSVAIHFGTFPLGDDGVADGPQALRQARAAAGIAEDAFVIPEFGTGYDIAPLPGR